MTRNTLLDDTRPITPEGPPTQRRRRTPLLAFVVVLLAAIAIATVVLVFSGGETTPPTTPEPAPAEVAPAPEPGTDPDVRKPERDITDRSAIVHGDEPRANWDVSGVTVGDRLNVRAGPDVSFPVIATLPPYTVELESTGRITRVDGSLWREIVVPGATTGWVNARYLTETRPLTDTADIPGAAAATAYRIAEAARSRDWERLAAVALEGGTPFTAAFGEELNTVPGLAAYWRMEAAREPIDEIIPALVALPEWYVTTARDNDGPEVPMHVSPRFMHEPTAANRAALEAALGADRVSRAVADGQYLGWRLGITAGGDWQFLVRGD
jgi:hypothetical protein